MQARPVEGKTGQRRSSASRGKGPLKISIGTYNINGQAPGEIDLDPWLRATYDEPDILIVGLQEADGNRWSYVLWTPYVEDSWAAAIESSLGSKADEYEKLATKQLVGTLMLVYVRKGVADRITGLATASVGTGFGGWAANKGAVGVRFEVDSIMSVCFVVSHLSAFQSPEARERRRWDYLEIEKRLRFWLIDSEGDDHQAASQSQSGSATTDAKTVQHRDAAALLRAQLEKEAQLAADTSIGDDSQVLTRKELAIMDHDVVFWAGDLNFRLDLGIGEVKRLITKSQFEGTLLTFDELRSEMQAQTCFAGFREQPIRFAPTYKFDRGTDEYDTSEKMRTPSWTDRVLWKQRKDVVKPLHYESCPGIRLSDHKPVLATFLIKVK